MVPNIPGFNILLVRLAMDLANTAYSGMRAFTGGTMMYNNSRSAKGQPVFYVYEKNSALWVCIRGSVSQADWETDFDYKESPHKFGNYSITCHGGFYKSAKFVYSKIKQLLYDYDGYIYITGHSYGASVSTIVSLMAMTDPNLAGKLDKIGGFCFAAAPSVNKIPSPYDKKICTFVYNNDIVPTISIPNSYNNFKPMIPKSKASKPFVVGIIQAAISIFNNQKQQFSKSLYKAIMAKVDPIVDDLITYSINQSYIKVSNLVGTVYALNNKNEKLEADLVPGTKYKLVSISATSMDDHHQSKYINALKHKTD
ncbi:Lipase family protein [Trichomonas vaginalis G3]|uniref:sn-1-specific diacylglycerol lipase n=1 Tax=Trichomonas vaginalis (strain ATCC PRA-98 / G3) TaxID=412133 RepID=A2E5X0_TRIV3|nr:lipase [Trichomonas vaginalis G3]EAY11927.1 Lipase family protein [Trichomonas vaginalis G3]KAI5530408.1 retrograde trans-synaptic signaling by lipid [Trichomonas vaginalis G3]|eukprot:XP_001324150.1 lipase [Trichomonas vaginalis G3]